ncbi:MAG TPA: thiamine pyrophosphate-dependent enzyme [Stellaceae bacterium]|jgi:thiamine pyrophosphate-dependent acetolactate synthase large subunit-like protein|nr:thiamine pyrophosphate-dependent enzyme [Stellaceae bacterium]
MSSADSGRVLSNEPQAIERPLPSEGRSLWGSDVAADMLRALDIPYVALNPGASYRGLHDSIVNRLGNEKPQMLLCLHEESAVALAHGWAKVTNKPMGAIVHSNVGLLHGSMAVFNAWMDRAPLLLFGATGPVDATKRRPWIDWIHTTKDQAALIRNFIKWDDQPGSVGAIPEAMLRAKQISTTAPCGPTYICFDAALQEQRLDALPAMPDASRFPSPMPVAPPSAQIEDLAKRLHAAQRPLLLMGRFSRSEEGWKERVALAEALDAVVLTELRNGAAFPTDHRLMGVPPLSNHSAAATELMRQADVVVSLDWVDLGGMLQGAAGKGKLGAYVVRVSVDQYSHNGFGMEYHILPPADLYLTAESDATVSALLAAVKKLGARKAPAWPDRKPAPVPALPAPDASGTIYVPHIAVALQKLIAGRKTSLLRHSLSWHGHFWPMKDPLDSLGTDGGGGVGSGPGTSVGMALALKGSGRLPIAVLGDGDFMMGNPALWTAVHYRVPLLIVICNNRSFYNDELHQERVAKERDRAPANKWIGQHMGDPDLDFATIARGQGAVGIGPVKNHAELEGALKQAIAAVDDGKVVVVDVRVAGGYDAGASANVPRGQKD